MVTEIKTYEPRVEIIEKVWTPNAKLWVPHKEEEIAIVSPSLGLDTYLNVGKKILSSHMQVPTGDYTASLVHGAYCGPKEFMNSSQIADIRKIMRRNWLWVYNQNNWNDKGVFVILDTEAEGGSEEIFPLSELEKMVLKQNGAEEIHGVSFSKDKKVRFAPKGTYRLGEHTPQSLLEDGFVIASYSVDGAKKLGEVSSKFGDNPITYGVEVAEGNQPKLRVSALVGNRLHVNGDDFGGYLGHAFGVL